MSEDINLKKRFGNLGIYLIEDAKQKIKEMSQQTLFQKAEIKKSFRERVDIRASKLKTNFVEEYMQKLNTNLSSTFLRSKNGILLLKNDLINQFIEDLKQNIKKRIKTSYSRYISHILEYLQELKSKIDVNESIYLYFNRKDHEYFNENLNLIKEIIGDNIHLIESNQKLLGGFILEQANGMISFDYTISNIINNQKDKIQQKFGELILASKLKVLEEEFEEYINKQKENIDRFLKEYDRI